MKTIKLPKSKKAARLAIVDDAIKQLKAARRMRVLRGNHYVVLNGSTTAAELESRCTSGKGVSCTVCALGALFLSTVRKFDRLVMPFSFNEFDTIFRDDVSHNLGRHFSRPQMSLIEDAFESIPEYDELGLGYWRIRNDRARLLTILLNMRRNGGEFIPTVKDFSKRKAVLA